MLKYLTIEQKEFYDERYVLVLYVTLISLLSFQLYTTAVFETTTTNAATLTLATTALPALDTIQTFVVAELFLSLVLEIS